MWNNEGKYTGQMLDKPHYATQSSSDPTLPQCGAPHSNLYNQVEKQICEQGGTKVDSRKQKCETHELGACFDCTD